MLIFQIVFVILVSIALFYGVLYNGLVTLRQKVKEGFAGIDIQLKRRHDLIPNLVETVKGYATHEQETLEKVTKARTSAMGAPSGDMKQVAGMENMLTGALKSIFALSENYPDLKANENFIELQKELSETENQVAASRRIYNANVTAFNVRIDTFPSNMVAGAHNIVKAEFYDLDEEERENMEEAPDVSFE